MLTLNNVEVVYLDVVLALTEVSMRIDDGSIVVLLGNNGAGKSTTLKAISGVLGTENGELNAGSVELNGKKIDNLDPEDIARLGICHVLQGHPVFENLTTEENLKMGAYLQKDNSRNQATLHQVYNCFPRLQALKERKSGYLSGGEQQMLVIGRAMMAQPRIMLLDEPSLGLAPRIMAEIFRAIKRINQEQKMTFVIAEQNAYAVLPIATHGYVLQTGRVVLEGTVDVLLTHPEVRKSYLGPSGQNSEENYYSYIRQKRTGGL